jgi:uncharacterized repeat protein (TIGR01451 family)
VNQFGPTTIRATLITLALLLCSAAGLPAAASAATSPGPGWTIHSQALPTRFSADDNAGCQNNAGLCDRYELTVTNAGSQPADGSTVTLTDELPAGLTIQNVSFFWSGFPGGLQDLGPFFCTTAPLQCQLSTADFGLPPIAPDDTLKMVVSVTVDDPSATGTLTNAGTVDGGGAPSVATSAQNPLAGPLPAFGPASFGNYIAGPDGAPDTQAGDHPYELTTRIDPTTDFRIAPDNFIGTDSVTSVEDLKDVAVDLPLGFLGNAQATPQCTFAELASAQGGGCSADTVIGHISAPGGVIAVNGPLFNMVPELGEPAEFAFVDSANYTHVLHASVVPTAAGYVLRTTSRAIPQVGLQNIVATLFGNPAAKDGTGNTPVAFFTNPSHCDGQPVTTTLHMDSWQHPGATNPDGTPDLSDPNWASATSDSPPVTGCNQLHFDPTLTVQPDSTSADSPSGLDVEIKVPQSTDPATLATPPLKKGVVTLPQGVSVNPAAADGLGACSPAQIDLASAASPSCPDSSKVGTVQLQTPLLPGTLQGSIYLATQNDNPFNSLLAGYIVVDDPDTGVVIKIPGNLTPDPVTGQITGVFDNNPQFPFSDLKLHFFGGDRGELATPQTCGTYQTTSELTPWSAPDSGPPATPSDSFQITSGPGGGPCPDLTDPSKFTPGFSAGTISPQAGSYSPFVLKVTRPDGQQYLKKIDVTLPLGLTAKLAGIPRCPQSQITPGVGGSTNCDPASQVGTVNVGAGTGSSPFFLKDQPVYLTEGYGGAPFGLAIDTHALAGPLDLGHVVVRSKLNVDPQTAQVSADAETLPDILQGIPLRIRSITLTMDHPAFTLNPTNCNPQAVTGQITGGGADFQNPADDTTKTVTDHFQVGGCGALGFSPKLSGTILNGAQGIHRSDHPNLNFHLAETPGDANLASVAVTLPQAFQIDQANLGNICSETQLAQNQCAGRNTVGTATATTPLLNAPLSGPVYAVSGSGGLPKLAVILNGEVNLLVRGITTTSGAQIVNTFPAAPDAPVTSFDLTLNGGPAGYLVNNRNVCGKSVKRHGHKRFVRTPLNAAAVFTAQDGDTRSQTVPIAAQCPKAKKSKKRHAGRK